MRETPLPKWTLLLLPLATCACDAWPTTIDNRAPESVTFSYLHKDFDVWSGEFPVRPGRAVHLARGHYFGDIRGIRIKQGVHEYAVANSSLSRFHTVCDQAPNCYLTYFGNGQIAASAEPQNGINFETAGGS